MLHLHRCELLGTDTNGCLPRAALCHGPHESTSHEPPAMAPPPRLCGVASCKPSGVASREPSSATSSRHATLFRWLSIRLCHQPSLAAPSEWSAAYVSILHCLLCATVEHCTQVLGAVCSPLSSRLRSAGPPANTDLHVLLSSLIRADSPQHVLRTAPSEKAKPSTIPWSGCL